MNVPSDPGFTPATIISVPVQTVVRLAATGSGACATRLQAPALAADRSDAELEPPTKPAPIRIAAAAAARLKTRRRGSLILVNLDIVSSSPCVFSLLLESARALKPDPWTEPGRSMGSAYSL
jgi:hypothetical protein